MRSFITSILVGFFEYSLRSGFSASAFALALLNISSGVLPVVRGA